MNPLIQNLIKFVSSIVKPIEITTGFSKLDKITRGLRRGELTIIAGRPSMGKSSLMLDIAKHTGTTINTAIFSMEMNEEQLVDRMIASMQGVTLYDLQDGKVKIREDVIETIKQLKISIDDNVSITTKYIWESLSSQPYDVVFVDYINLFRKSSRQNSRCEEIGEVVQQLRNIARRLNISIVGLCQLNRALENRENHRPRLSDLRESGEIEQIADNIIFINRPSYYKIFDEGNVEYEDDYEAELIVAKNRNGPIGIVKAVWRPYLSSFIEPNWKEDF